MTHEQASQPASAPLASSYEAMAQPVTQPASLSGEPPPPVDDIGWEDEEEEE